MDPFRALGIANNIVEFAKSAASLMSEVQIALQNRTYCSDAFCEKIDFDLLTFYTGLKDEVEKGSAGSSEPGMVSSNISLHKTCLTNL